MFSGSQIASPKASAIRTYCAAIQRLLALEQRKVSVTPCLMFPAYVCTVSVNMTCNTCRDLVLCQPHPNGQIHVRTTARFRTRFPAPGTGSGSREEPERKLPDRFRVEEKKRMRKHVVHRTSLTNKYIYCVLSIRHFTGTF